ncbi:trans-aconitate 2-methyltransferase [Polaromonas sp.]|uniref:class I SAM-dependent methyltransferase n=1 Tax=Polaromonas sp. TaxID=1869339 RepID=UPI002731D227|nr:class I SAM-dependent methyltransferase [Polaromonas sp.]MDP1884924.1 class I SAM-dependent methyltransferase [Polaromonas sp.]
MMAKGAGAAGETLAPAPDQRLVQVHSGIERYYSQKVLAHGATALGVDWTCQPTQELRFVQILKLCDFRQPFSLNDVGCGYGALLAFLAKRHRGAKVDYLGTDLSQAMIDQAKPSPRPSIRSQFVVTGGIPRVADYSVASGIFNVKLNQPTARWTLFIQQMLAGMHAASRLGFAVNFLAPPGPDMQAIPELYRVSPDVWIRHCERQFGAKVELVEGYGMREFTLIVRH